MLYVESQHSLFDIGKIFLGDSFLTSTIASQCSGSKAQQLLALESAFRILSVELNTQLSGWMKL